MSKKEPTGIEIARKLIGESLSEVRKSKSISLYQITKTHGLKFDVIKSIEEGSKNYTIDSFLTYISALNVYFFLEDKDGDADLSSLDRVKKMLGDKPNPDILQN